MPMMVPSLMWPGTRAMERWTRKLTLRTSMAAPAMKKQARPACQVMAVASRSLRFTRPYVKYAVRPRPGAITKGRLPRSPT